ncbi:MAG: TIR domain-containing protein [Nitrosomonas sp.]|nr:TIR domain-containing protein [Nitrosomonas sp.]
MDDRKQNRFWNQLLALISKGNVVPIVGEDLLFLSPPTENYLYNELALRYANYNGLDKQSLDLSSTVRSHPEFRSNPYDIYQEIGDEYESLNPAIPNVLSELAKIKHFNLFVSTTFDNLLERALNQERFDGRNLTRVIIYSPKNIPNDQEISDALKSGYPVVLQLFGSYKCPLQFALTEGDKVEYMHALQSSEYCPKRILQELQDRPLIMIGNKFPDWLTRIFLRMMRRVSLDHRDIPKQYFAGHEITDNPILNFFLRRFTTNSELVEEQDPIQFTLDLSEKWQEKYREDNSSHSTSNPSLIDTPMPRNAVFISYCASKIDGSISQDCSSAISLKKALENAGISVWLDHDQLQAGDEYQRKIERYINTCSLFIPLISVTTESRNEGFFRKEWSLAIKRLPDFTGSDRNFLLPVVLGDIDPYKAAVPDEFKRYQFYRLSSDESIEEFIEIVRDIYDKAHSFMA